MGGLIEMLRNVGVEIIWKSIEMKKHLVMTKIVQNSEAMCEQLTTLLPSA